MQSVQPIPAEFYDEAYYTGVTSNYANGYEWENIGQGMVITARFLINALFPEANDFLDFGAAKGFLVRALREHGKLAWGVEHSPYCLQVAEAEAKPYLVASLHDFSEERVFDVVTAFETLEHLTQPQIAEVLPALRKVTGHALFATVPCADMVSRHARDMADKDPTHITIVSRLWWIEQFEAAGFVHGYWQRVVEQYCAFHPLVQTSGWNVFVLGVAS